MKSLRHGTPLYHLGVDLDRLDARLVRVADGGLADGVVAAARAEHLLGSLRWLCSSRRFAAAACPEALLTLCLRGRATLQRGAVVKAAIDAGPKRFN